MSKPDGGPAFPVLEKAEIYDRELERHVAVMQVEGGMTLRDYFAAQALARIVGIKGEWWPDDPERHAGVARVAYELADAMLAERAK